MEIHFLKNQFRFQRKRPFWKDSSVWDKVGGSYSVSILGSQICDGMFSVNDKRS